MNSLMAPVGSSYTKVPVGNHFGRCYRVVQLGRQMNERFGKRQPKVLINWEIPDLRHQSGEFEGDPLTVGSQYTLSANAKARLRKDLEWWYGKRFDERKLEAAGGFDLKKILGRPGELTIEHNGEYVNVAGLSPDHEEQCGDAVLETMFFTFDTATHQEWSSLSEGLQKWIRQAEEWPQLASRLGIHADPSGDPWSMGGSDDNRDDDIPF